MELINLTGQNKHSTPENLPTLSALFMDGDDVFFDNGAIHGKSKIERGITFSKRIEDVPDGRRVVLIWITLRKTGDKKGYAGLTSCDMKIDQEKNLGYKNLAMHVNQMDAAIKGKVNIDSLSATEKQRLHNFLQTFRPELWENTSQELKNVF